MLKKEIIFDVYTNKSFAGKLHCKKNKYDFVYDDSAVSNISLTMDRNYKKSFSFDDIPFVFDSQLPEGFSLKYLIDMLRKAKPFVDKSDILEVTGKERIGHLTIVPEGDGLNFAKVPYLSEDKIHTNSNSKKLFDGILKKNAKIVFGISGAMPKTLFKTRTEKTANMIIKHDPDYVLDDAGKEAYPFLSINEFLSLKAAENSGNIIPDIQLSIDGKAIFIKRFDIKDNGERLGVDDFAVLSDIYTVYKYGGTIEDCALSINEFAYKDSAKLFRRIVTSLVLGDDDMHLKNLSLTFDINGEVKLSPAYDIVTGSVYSKSPVPSIFLTNKERDDYINKGKGFHRSSWFTKSDLLKVAPMFSVTKKMAQKIINEVCEGISKTIPLSYDLVERYPEFKSLQEKIINEWEKNILLFQNDKELKSLKTSHRRI